MNWPLAISRQDHILNALDAAGAVSVSLLAERLGVSRETIRRDLKTLADQGRANLVHGGAARGATAEPSLATRQAANAAGKAAIAPQSGELRRGRDGGDPRFGLDDARARLCAR